MSRFYSFNFQKKKVRCASVLKDFLPNKKHLLNRYNELPTDLYKLFFVSDICTISIFRTKREILLALKEKLENAEITAEEFKKFKKEIKDFKG